MYTTITFECSDGTDPKCVGKLKRNLDYIGLTEEQIEHIIDQEGQTQISLTPDQIKINSLDKGEYNYCDDDNRAWIDIDFNTICYACGSES